MALLEAIELASPLTLALALVGFACAATVLLFSIRLLLNKPRAEGGGVFPPWALRLAAALYIALPLSALLAGQGSHLEFGWPQLALQGTVYLLVGVALFRLAISRERQQSDGHQS